MNHLYQTEKTRMVYLRNEGKKMHFKISAEFDPEEVRKIVTDEYPKARPVLMVVEREVPEKELA